MENGEIIIISIIFSFLFFVIIIIVVWILLIQQKPKLPTPPQYAEAGYSMICDLKHSDENYLNCAPGLKCTYFGNDNIGICKAKLGSNCSTIYECSNDALYCTGVCSKTLSGSLNQQGPCLTDNMIENELNICKIKENREGCNKNNDCISGSCVDVEGVNMCILQYDNGSICDNKYQCSSLNCSLNICQQQNITTGEKYSYCDPSKNLSCNQSLSCNINYQDVNMSSGTCQPTVSNWPIIPCDVINSCIYPTICWNGQCVMPRTTDTYITNSCTVNNFCTLGYKCDNGICIPVDAVPYPSTKSGLVKMQVFPPYQTSPFFKMIERIGEIENIDDGTFSFLTNYNIDYFIYRNNGTWLCNFGEIKISTLYKNLSSQLYPVQPSYKINIINIMFTYSGNIMITYCILASKNVYRCYITEFNDNFNLELVIYTNSLDTFFDYGITIKKVDIIDIEDKLGYIKISFIDNDNNLYISLMTKKYLNGLSDKDNYLFQYITNKTEWCQVYTSQTIYDINEYYFQYIGSVAAYVMTPKGQMNIRIPSNEIEEGIIMNKGLYGYMDIFLLYLAQYPEIVGNIVLRGMIGFKDLVLPGYFDKNYNLCVSKKHKNMANKDFLEKYISYCLICSVY